jgi:hypothetical protein
MTPLATMPTCIAAVPNGCSAITYERFPTEPTGWDGRVADKPKGLALCSNFAAITTAGAMALLPDIRAATPLTRAGGYAGCGDRPC